MNKVSLEKNVGIHISSLDADYDDLNDDEEVLISHGECGPSIQFSDWAMDCLCKPWRNALIIKLLEDLNFVLTSGPWIIAGQYLVMQKWRPGFCPATAHITRMAAWFRVSAIQLECFDVWSLKRIGNMLGKLLKIDSLTTAQNRGKFARLCVELDLTKPLEAFVQINQNWYNIEYEGLPDICYHCGRYGHKRENCELRVKVPAYVNTESTVGDDSDKMKTGSAGVSVIDPSSDSGLRGPWMNVQSRRRPKPDFKASSGKGFGAKVKGSRFDALRNLSDNFGRDEAASDVFVEQDKSNFNSSFDVEHGKKGAKELSGEVFASGQTVNYDKSVIFCSPNTRKETAKEVSLICGSPLTEDLSKYLRMPMLHSRITKLTYGSLIDKVHKRLASWKSKFLSLAGRATLKQAVTSAVPIYAMQTSKLPDCSTTWKGVMYGVELLRQGIGWRVGKGDTTKFWKDSWLIDEPLLKHDGVLRIEDIDCSVSNFFKDEWLDLDKLQRALTEDLVQHVVNYPVGFASNLQDCQIWKGTANGVFSVKTAYNMFFKGPSWPDYSFSSLWKLKIPPKLKIFAWLTAQGKILSNEQRVRRQLTLDASCGVCEWPIETTLHILRDCYKARDIWNTILMPRHQGHFFQMDFLPWFQTNLLSQAVCCSNIPWSMLIVRAVHEWFKASHVLSKHNHKVQVDLKWEPPISGQFKLNVDGSRRNGSGHIGAGGVIRNSSGDWISGFAVNLGKGQILEAEIWGLFFGLKLAMDKEINNLVVEMDSALAVQLIQKQGLTDVRPLAALVASWWELMHKINCCSVYHLYREKNSVADCLATWSYNLDLSFYIFVDAPAWIGPSLIDDLLGITRSRLVPTGFAGLRIKPGNNLHFNMAHRNWVQYNVQKRKMYTN
ncbi:hypothetical protein L3X38_010003 [Prunus dulcis]|uniref:CCHC-type domain-containing protein n=1 Tax=Prunus dulcis TaxID=3755 RepID=A0AAD4ZEC8_PRUDU|nr:hypothetical protein L3X38_010003 [Prunus dulcis]